VVDITANLARYRALSHAIQEGLAASVHDCSDAGLGTAIAETALAGDLGIELDLGKVAREGIDRDDVLLFSESAGRFVVTVGPENAARFEEIMAGTSFARAGLVTAERRVVIRGLAGGIVVDLVLAEVSDAWRKPLLF
jgi:phosphoribosylformylglycinamidine synthase